MAKMYIREDDTRKPFVGEQLSLRRFSVSVPLSGSVDNPLGFVDNKGKAVYVPDDSILVRNTGGFYHVEVFPDEEVENSSCFGYHKDAVHLVKVDKGRLEREVDPDKLIYRKFRFAGYCPL
ncbi:MAG: hypothetical protein Q7S06_03575 [Nanoarchaeota archaeon]|nr:hypothetical protein [Nanoarchaeota archaeon]